MAVVYALAHPAASADPTPVDAPPDDHALKSLFERAKRTQDHRDYARAEAALRDALKRNAKHVPGMILLATCHLDRHRFIEAVELAGSALAAQPDARDALAVRGDAYLQLGELDRAREDYQKLFAAQPDLLAHARMAGLLLAEGDAPAALDAWQAAVKSGERANAPAALRAWCHVRLGELRFRTGNWDAAEDAYRRAEQLAADDPDVLDHLAELHGARGEFDDAIKLSDRAMKSGGQRPEFMRNRGDLCAAAGKADEALTWHDKALAAFVEAAGAGHAPAQRHLASMYCDVESVRDPAEALRWARRDVQVRRTVATLAALAWAQYHDGKPAEAAATMDRALRAKTVDTDILYRAGLIYPQTKDTTKGRLYLRRAAIINPRFQEFHFFR
jgi:tetratricopeptide (TPR) repeat protein